MSTSVQLATGSTYLLDDEPKRLLIGGEWIPAQSGKTFDSINPSTGEVIGRIAEGESADADLAVAAARRAFEGPWRKFNPQQRQNVMLKFADLIEQNLDELRLLDVLDMGAPISRGITSKGNGRSSPLCANVTPRSENVCESCSDRWRSSAGW